MPISTPERSPFSLFRRITENPASGGTQLTRLARAFGAAALLAVAAGCGSSVYEPNGRRLGGSDIASPDGTGGPKDDGGILSFDAGDARNTDSGPDSGKIDDGGDAGSGPNGGTDGGPDAGPDGGTPPVCPVVTCREGVGACERAGTVLYDADCNPAGCSVGAAEPADSEDCSNGLDDDCNGEINDGCACVPDETVACYTGGEDTRSQGACHDGNLSCGADGQWNPCEGQVTPTEEACGNGVDDDCDVETDEGCGGGVECFAGEGICRTAGLTRADGSCDAVPGVPEATDLCGDGLDNDCANGIDDGCVCPAETTQPCYQGSADTLNVGVCRPGIQTCIDGRRWSPACEGQTLPSAEQCNGEDDNCNRETDENITRPCSTDCGEGIEVCRDGAFRDCNAPLPQPETCNDIDDNCDGTTDEEGCPCTAGRGICERDGIIQADGRCDAVAGDPDPAGETCNILDDDCNGETDEGLTRPCSTECGSGDNLCVDGGYVCNAPTPQPETCNGADDDCDTLTDEENAGGCSPFFRDGDIDTYGTAESRCICAPEGEFTAARSGDCADGNPAINPGAAEVTNVADDNCNGWADESDGINVRCEPGASMNFFGSDGYGCVDRELRPLVAGGVSRFVALAGYEDPPAAIAHVTLVTLAPVGSPAYASVTAIHRAAPWGFSARAVGVSVGCSDGILPPPPAGKEARCYKAPSVGSSDDIPGSTIEFFIEP